METKFLNFKKVEVTGATKEEALAKAPFQVIGDATQAYKNWKNKQTTGVTEAMTKEFMLEYLQKKSKSAAGVGYSITIEAAVPDTRERPYTIKDVKNEQGKRKFGKVYRLVDDATGEILGVNKETKASAKNQAKEIIANGFHGKGTCYISKDVSEGEPVAFKFEYTPSKAAKSGRWLVFGNEA